jgi:Na+-driven multidrug efflux pump
LITILLNVVFNIYLINAIGIHGAALASLLSTLMAFIIVNVTNPSEIYLIAESFSLKTQRQSAIEIFNIIFVKKNPDKFEKTND